MNIDVNSITQAKILNKAIGGGGGGVKPTGTLSISSNGNYNVTNYAEAEVAVPLPSGTKQVTISNAGTVTEDVTDFEQVEITTQGLVKPTGTKEITENGTGIDVSAYASVDVNVPSQVITWDSRGLEYNSWDAIQKCIRAGGSHELISVGDTKTFVINGNTYTAEVVAVNDGTSDAGEWYPDKTVDFITKELYETNYPYRSNTSNTGGFKNSSIKNTLNNTIYPLLPDSLKAVIIEKSHLYQCGEYFGSSWYTNMQEISTNLWLPTLYETRASTGTKDENSTNNKQYTLSSLIKDKVGTTTATAWWLSSPYTGSSKNVYSISNSGSTTSGTSPTATYIGVPICFRIG